MSASISAPAPPPAPHSEGKSFAVTLVLSVFFGFLGADRFYLGHGQSARIKLLTLGGLGYWWLIDIVITLLGGQRDGRGRPLAGMSRHAPVVRAMGGIVAGLVAIGLAASVFQGTVGQRMFSGITLAVLLAGGVFAAVRMRRAVPTAPDTGGRREAGVGIEAAPAAVRVRLRELGALRGRYEARARGGDQIAASVAQKLDALMGHTADLFARLTRRTDRGRRAGAAADCESKLADLVAATGEDYLLDVLARPELWDDSAQRIRDVLQAIEAVDAAVVEDIRQLNARRGIALRTPLNALIGPRKDLDDWQRDFDRAASGR